MTTPAKKHLDDDQIIKAVVDRADLDRQLQQHLEGCRRCQSQIEALTLDLGKIAHIAAESSPVVKRPFRAPAANKSRVGWLPFGRRLTTGLAVAMACIIVGGLYWQHRADQRSQQIAREMHEAKQLMLQVNRLVENPLPEAIITIGAEGVNDHDEDFFKFLIPDESGDTALSRMRTKGLRT